MKFTTTWRHLQIIITHNIILHHQVYTIKKWQRSIVKVHKSHFFKNSNMLTIVGYLSTSLCKIIIIDAFFPITKTCYEPSEDARKTLVPPLTLCASYCECCWETRGIVELEASTLEGVKDGLSKGNIHSCVSYVWVATNLERYLCFPPFFTSVVGTSCGTWGHQPCPNCCLHLREHLTTTPKKTQYPHGC